MVLQDWFPPRRRRPDEPLKEALSSRWRNGDAKHAKEHAMATKAETVGLHKKGAAAAAATLRGLSDAELGRSATVLTGMPPMSVEQIVGGILLHHIDEHLGSIKATIGY